MDGRIHHPFEPICDAASRILILGTIPSPKSREVMFYYGHPQNRFWKILSELFDEPPLGSIEEKKAFLLRHHIALWDVLSACDIRGADDASIRNPVPNDLNRIFSNCTINAVFTNGSRASAYYRRFFLKTVKIPWIELPSTSPANCRNWTYETLRDAYRIILRYL